MERPLMWAIIQITIFLSLNVRYLLCQHNYQGGSILPTGTVAQSEEPKECLSANLSPTPQLMNTLLTIAAANGVLPELLPKIQPLRSISQESPYSSQDMEYRTLTAAPVQQSTALRQPQPMVSTNPKYTHTIIPPAYETTASRPVPFVPPIVISPGLNPVNQQNNPFIPPIPELPQPSQLVLQSQPNDELCFCHETMVASGQIPSSAPILPMANVPSTLDIKRLNLEPVCANSVLMTENGLHYPVNLQISIPPPNVEAPKITFINAALPTSSLGNYPSTDVSTLPYSNWFPYGYTSPPQPQQIIIKKRKSPFKDCLPLILYSMIHSDRSNCKSGGCCCCRGNSGNSGTVPIPYPIPISTNSPIISTSCYSNFSRHRGSKSDRYIDE